MKKPKHDLTHVRHDPAHCLAPGLFRSLKRGDRKRCKLDVTYTFGEDESMRFVGFEPLGADDMRLLQGIVALGGPNGILLTPEPTSETGRQLRLFLEPRFEAIEQDGFRSICDKLACQFKMGAFEYSSRIRTGGASGASPSAGRSMAKDLSKAGKESGSERWRSLMPTPSRLPWCKTGCTPGRRSSFP